MIITFSFYNKKNFKNIKAGIPQKLRTTYEQIEDEITPRMIYFSEDQCNRAKNTLRIIILKCSYRRFTRVSVLKILRFCLHITQ